MKTIFNFSHPLSQKAADQIAAAVGENTVVQVRFQLDLQQPLEKQVRSVCRAAIDKHGQPDYLLPPMHAYGAILVDRYFNRPEDDYPPVVTYKSIIRLVMENGTTPPVFVLAEIWE